MTPRIVNGWVVVPCDAGDFAKVDIAVSQTRSPGKWFPGFRDWLDGKRVAQARCVPRVPGMYAVWLRVDGKVTGPHRIRV